MKYILLIVSLLMAGCADQPVRQTSPEPDTYEATASNPTETEEFGSYLRLFQKEAESRGIKLHSPLLDHPLHIYKVAGFRKDLQEKHVIGLCSSTASSNTIYIYSKAWDTYDSQQREMLLFHELGHCVLDLEHDSSTDSDGIPNDLMYPVNFNSYYYFQNRKFYLDHLFSKVKRKSKEHRSASKTNACQWGKKFKGGNNGNDSAHRAYRH